MRITLEFEAADGFAIDVRAIQPGTVLGMPGEEVARLPAGMGRRQVTLGEVCRVLTEAVEIDELVFSGATGRLEYAGYGMEEGRLFIDGDAGKWAGAGMTGGEIEIRGSAGDYAGAGMQGGLVRVRGSAGDWCGANQPGQAKGMLGGMLLVGGSCGREAGAGMRRGLIYAGGDAGEYTGSNLLAGTIMVGGTVGRTAGVGMRRGSIVAGKLTGVLPGFNPAGPADDEWLRIMVRYLARVGVTAPDEWAARSPRRFTGDTLGLGKGEILAYDFIE